MNTLRSTPVFRLLLFFLAGMALFEIIGFSSRLVLGLLFIFTLILIVGISTRKRHLSSLGVYAYFLILGFSIFELRGWPSNGSKLKPDEIEQISASQVQLYKQPENKPKSYKVMAELIQVKINNKWHKRSGKVLLYFGLSTQKAPKFGDIYLLNGNLRAIEGVKNPYEFDYATYQNKRGIVAHDFLRAEDYHYLGNKPPNLWDEQAIKMNEYARNTIHAFVKNTASRAVADAMIIGLKDELDNNLKEAYATAGAVHILAVSGLHVGIVLLLLQFLFKPLLKIRGGVYLQALFIILLIWIYALFTGLSPSVSRAALMFTLIELGLIIKRDKNTVNVVALSALLLLLFKPVWIYEVGFQLSYLAVLGIVVLYPYLNQLFTFKYSFFRWLWQVTAVSLAAQLFTTPLSIYYFHQFPNFFWLSNPIVSFLSSIILFAGMALLFLFWVPALGWLIALVFNVSLWLTNQTVFFINQLPGARTTGLVISLPQMFLLYGFIFLLLMSLLKKEPKLLYLAAGFMGIVLFQKIGEDFKQQSQAELSLHFIPKAAGISLIKAKTAVFLADSAELADPRIYNFHLKNYYEALGVKTIKKKQIGDNNYLLTFENEKLLWLRKRPTTKIEGNFSKIMISNNAVWSLAKTFTDKSKTIYLDDSNSRKNVSRLKMEADSLGYKLLSLYDSGGLRFDKRR